MPHLGDRNHTLTAQFSFLTTDTADGRRLNTFVELRRPATDLDMKLQFRYELSGPKTSVLLLARYAKDKDVIVDLYLTMPRGNLLFVEGKLNVTLPSFTPMVLEGKLHEKSTSNFDVSFHINYFRFATEIGAGKVLFASW